MKQFKFNVGDKVRYIGEAIRNESNGELPVGTIISTSNFAIPYLVEFNEVICFTGGHTGHTGNGLSDKDGCCWWCEAHNLEAVGDQHYETAVQPIEFMQANMSHEEFIGFLKGNIIKYTARCGKKDDVNKEVSKIIKYAKWLAKAYKGETIDPRES